MTGDTHGDFSRFYEERNGFLMGLNKDDYMIICGDFGGAWFGSPKDDEALDKLNELPFTTLFVDGNHENFDLLNEYQVEQWNGGNVHFIRPSIVHLMRGQIYEINGSKFLSMGGAKSHDVSDGILNRDDPNFEGKLKWLRRNYRRYYRINHETWWKEEIPSDDEWVAAMANIERNSCEVDYVITHDCPSDTLDRIGNGMYAHTEVSDGLQNIYKMVRFKQWFFGHYHANMTVDVRFELLYDKIVRLYE